MSCAVPYCVADEMPGLEVCAIHKDAALVEEIGCVAQRCGTCRRQFKKGEWVERFRRGPSTGRQHVRCEPIAPRPTRRDIRESEKPLLK